ncbi:MAG: hypothetical protein KDA44_15420 [Planctomycetales bacterium]|nr:hypothetical protein [Planctomycetales bacterium]
MSTDSANPLPPQGALLGSAVAAYAAELPRGRQRRRLQALAADLTSDRPLAETTAASPLAARWLPLLSNDAAGSSPLVRLPALLRESEASFGVRRRQFHSLLYPLLVVVAALAVLTFLGLTVMPTFDDIYSDFSLELPWLTRVAIAWSRAIRFHPREVAVAIVAIVTLGIAAWRLVVSKGWGGFLFSTFTAGSTGKVVEAATLVRRAVELSDAGLALPGAVAEAGLASQSPALRRGALAWAAGRAVESGFDRNRATHTVDPRDAKYLPATLRHILDAPELAENQRLGLLRALAETYGERAQARLGAALDSAVPLATVLAAPVAVVCVGVLVLGVVLALFLPLVCLINGLSG